MLEAPAFDPPARGTEGSLALPPIAEGPAASAEPGGPSTVPGLPRLFPADDAKAEPPATALGTEPVEPERQMAALAPSETRPELLPPMPEAEAEAPVDMARAIQEELARLGCYRSTIDGDWGPKSAKALLRYYATKKEAPDELDPNEMLLAKLSREEKVVCTRTESDRTVTKKKGGGETTAKKPVKPAPVAKKPAKQAPVAKKPATRSKVVRTPAPARPKPAPKVATEERKRKLGLGTGAFR